MKVPIPQYFILLFTLFICIPNYKEQIQVKLGHFTFYKISLSEDKVKLVIYL